MSILANFGGFRKFDQAGFELSESDCRLVKMVALYCCERAARALLRAPLALHAPLNVMVSRHEINPTVCEANVFFQPAQNFHLKQRKITQNRTRQVGGTLDGWSLMQWRVQYSIVELN